MKKTLILFIGIISFFGINTAKADTYITSNFYNKFDNYVNDYLTYKENINNMVNYWKENYSSQYPYYAIFSQPNDYNNSTESKKLILYCSSTNVITYNSSLGFEFHNAANNGLTSSDGTYYTIVYDTANNSYSYSIRTLPVINTNLASMHLLVANNLVYDNLDSEFDTISFPYFSSDTLNISINEFEISKGDIFPTIASLYDGSYDTDFTNYISINLNDYPYIALTLKDYSKRDTFYTNVYVKGQYCLTPVYNYGMTEKKDIIEGSKNQRCSTYYNDYTLVRTYILDQDIQNNAIYYLKAYDTSKENLVKVDSSMFGITYITEDTKDNPYVSISGKNYPTISYDKLTDTATKSEDEDYISGVSCQVGDFNCHNKYATDNIFNDLFDKPLEILKNIFKSITSIFDIITEFISLLPEQLQMSLYLSFVLALILGLIKIIL